jgi:hypothetical protein
MSWLLMPWLLVLLPRLLVLLPRLLLLLLLLLLQAWLTLTTWLLVAIWAPKFYATHRVPLVLLLKSVMAASVLHITNDSARLMHLPHSTPSFRMMLFQTAMISGLAHLPGLCVGQPLPLWAQLAWAVGRAGIFVLGAASRGADTHVWGGRFFLGGGMQSPP